MSQVNGPYVGAPTGTTGNNNGNTIGVDPGSESLALEFIVEVAGATPTVTYKLQGSLVANPGASDWFDLFSIPSDSDTGAITKVVTAVGTTVVYVSQAQTRFLKNVRLVTSANTNITYRANHYSVNRA